MAQLIAVDDIIVDDERRVEEFDRVRDELAKNDGIEMLYLQIRDEKCIYKLLEKAKITDAEVPKKGGAKSEKPAKAGHFCGTEKQPTVGVAPNSTVFPQKGGPLITKS